MVLCSGKTGDPGASVESEIKESTVGGAMGNIAGKIKTASSMAACTRSAARADWRAVTGPWTAEYGPSVAGKRKIVRMQTTAINVSLELLWPEIIVVLR
jgi:hypothetical protein